MCLRDRKSKSWPPLPANKRPLKVIDLHTLARCFVRKRRNWCCCFLFLFFSLEIPGVPIFTWFSFSLAGNRVEADRTGSKARNNVLIGPRNGIRHRLRHVAPYLAPIAQFHHLCGVSVFFFFFISLSIFFLFVRFLFNFSFQRFIFSSRYHCVTTCILQSTNFLKLVFVLLNDCLFCKWSIFFYIMRNSQVKIL